MCVCVCARAGVRGWVRVRARIYVVVGARSKACACECVALIIHMPRAEAILSAASLASPYFSALSHKRHDFRKKFIGYETYNLIFFKTYVWNISHSRDNSDRCCNKCETSRHIFLKSLNIRFHQNRSSGYRVVPCRRTDMTQLIVAFSNFAKALENMTAM